jgi:hypothetical protein
MNLGFSPGLWHGIVRRVGWPGLAGVVLLLLALLAGLFFVKPALEESWKIQKIHSRWLEKQNSLAPTSVVSSPPLSLDEKARTHIADLPALLEVPKIISRLHEMARSSGVSWKEAQFFFSPGSATQLPTYTLAFPVQGSYKGIREFMTASLNNEPALTLSDLLFIREDPNAVQLTAQVRLVLYLRPESTQ